VPRKRMHMRIRHTPDNLLSLVSDVEDYPRFVNLISSLRVRNEEKLSAHKTRFEADANVTYKMLNESFKSVVEADTEAKTITVEKSERGGPLRSLLNSWKFHELSDGSTLVDFLIEVKLKAFPLEMVLASRFDSASHQVMNAFKQRADQLYENVGEPELDLNAEYAALGLQRIP